jgi:hypothetical protein
MPRGYQTETAPLAGVCCNAWILIRGPLPAYPLGRLVGDINLFERRPRCDSTPDSFATTVASPCTPGRCTSASSRILRVRHVHAPESARQILGLWPGSSRFDWTPALAAEVEHPYVYGADGPTRLCRWEIKQRRRILLSSFSVAGDLPLQWSQQGSSYP